MKLATIDQEVFAYSPLEDAALARYRLSSQKQQEAGSLNDNFWQDILSAFEDPKSFRAETFMTYSIEVLLDYLKHTHAYYLEKRLSEIELSIQQTLDKAEPTQTDYWRLIAMLYDAWKKHIILHINQEETTLFPYVDKIQLAGRQEQLVDDVFSLGNFVQQHGDDNIDEGLMELTKAILKRAGDTETSMSVQVLLTQLELFGRDLHIHGMLEDHVLIPKALEIEKRVRN